MRTLLLLATCTSVEALPIVAPAGLDVTLDPGSGELVIEDATRRYAAPPAMMRWHVYDAEARFVRCIRRPDRGPITSRDPGEVSNRDDEVGMKANRPTASGLGQQHGAAQR